MTYVPGVYIDDIGNFVLFFMGCAAIVTSCLLIIFVMTWWQR